MSSATSTMMPSATVSAPPAASTTGAANGDNNGPTSRPLLFFVALGFGVVFTNLWIIVGVKYCFRYNQRARQAMLAEQNGDIIDLGNMQRPRRRREKKLMSMDEVNERFPLTKYKIWRAGREQEGLPSTGGITAPPSRAGSIREHYGGLKRVSVDEGPPAPEEPTTITHENGQHDISSETHDFASIKPQTQTIPSRPSSEEKPAPPEIRVEDTTQQRAANNVTSTQTTPTEPPTTTTTEDRVAEDDDDPARTAFPDPLLESTQPGDSCAICIESLDEDDEVRGLTCGHAFHASCIDPWLTSRRACCPLCKADYYVPKNRPDGDATNAGVADGANMPQQPPNALQRPRYFLGSVGSMMGNSGRPGWPLGVGHRPARVPRQRQQRHQDQDQDQLRYVQRSQQSGGAVANAEQNPTRASRFTNLVRAGRSRLPALPRRGPRGDTQRQQDRAAANAVASTSDVPTTPAQLEAGTR